MLAPGMQRVTFLEETTVSDEWDGASMAQEHLEESGLLGGVNLSFATDINPAGLVVGYFNTQEGVFQAFIWDDGIVTLLDPCVYGCMREPGSGEARSAAPTALPKSAC